MTGRALSAAEVAAHLGRSEDWLYRQWKRKLREEGMPLPVSQDPLAWNEAQFFTWLDRDLDEGQRAACAAYRAAARAYVDAGDPAAQKTAADWDAELARRLNQEPAA